MKERMNSRQSDSIDLSDFVIEAKFEFQPNEKIKLRRFVERILVSLDDLGLVGIVKLGQIKQNILDACDVLRYEIVFMNWNDETLGEEITFGRYLGIHIFVKIVSQNVGIRL